MKNVGGTKKWFWLFFLMVVSLTPENLFAGLTDIPVQLFVTDIAGRPLSKSCSVVVNLYSGADSPTSLYEEQFPAVSFEKGFAVIRLGASGALDQSLFRDSASLYVGVALCGDVELTPRLELASSPRAYFANLANQCSSLSSTEPLAISQGGTGATTAEGVRTGIGAAASGANSDITALSGLTTPLSVAQGGTGAATAEGARVALGASGVVVRNVTATGTAANANTQDLMSGTIPGGTLASDGDSIRCLCAGTATGSNDQSRVMTMIFGNTTLGTVTAMAGGADNAHIWRIEATIARTGANAQEASSVGMYRTGDAGGANVAMNRATPAAALSSDVTVKCTGQSGNGGASDVVQTLLLCEAL